MARGRRLWPWSLIALFSGQLFSSLGDFLFSVALMVVVYEQTGSALAVGYLMVTQTAPTFLLAPVAGVWTDRFNPKRIMIVSDLLRAVTVLSLLVNHSVISIYVVSALLTSFGVVFNPARMAFLPRVFDAHMLLRGNATISTGASFMRMIGPAIGAVITSKAGIMPAVWANAASFVLSALLVSSIPLVFAQVQEPSTNDGAQPGFWDMLREGMRHLANSPVAIVILGAGSLSVVGIATVSTLLVSYTTTQVSIGASAVGYLTSAEGVGAVVAGAGIGFLASRIQSRDLLGLGYGMVSASIFTLAATQNAPLAILAVSIAGAGMVASNVAEGTTLQVSVSSNTIGRVYSLITVAYALIQLVTAPLAGFLADRFGVRLVFVGCGIFLAAASAYAWLRLGGNRVSCEEGLKSAEN